MAASISIAPSIPGGLQAIAMGSLGADWIDNVTTLTGNWAIITALTDTVFSSVTQSTMSVNGGTIAASTLAGKTLTAGKSIYGRFSSITLTSGNIVAYRATAY